MVQTLEQKREYNRDAMRRKRAGLPKKPRNDDRNMYRDIYRDHGCNLHPECLECPDIQCKHDLEK